MVNHKYSKYQFPFLFKFIWIGTIGNCAEDIFWAITHARSLNKKIILIYPYDLKFILTSRFKFFKKNKFLNLLSFSKVDINYHLLDIQSEHVIKNNFFIFLIRFLITLYSILIKLILLIFKKKNILYIPTYGRKKSFFYNKNSEYFKNLIKILNKNDLDSYKHYIKRKNLLSKKYKINFNINKIKTCQKILKKNKIFINKKIVCVHIREKGYYINEGVEKSNRNSDPQKFVKAIEYLIRNNYFVIRMGDKSMKKLNISSPFFLDYPFTNIKSYMMDIYFLDRCEFFFGTISGLWQVANMFQKPVAIANLYQFDRIFPPKLKDLALLSNIYSNKYKRFLNLGEILSEYKENRNIFWDGSHKIYENTELQLLNFIKEFLSEKKISKQQMKFNKKKLELIDYKYNNNEDKKLIESILIAHSGHISKLLLKN